jgi:F0F1-type ATP synthase beta subunit
MFEQSNRSTPCKMSQTQMQYTGILFASIWDLIPELLLQYKELLDGRYDDLPEQAFYFVGGIDEAVAKSQSSLS